MRLREARAGQGLTVPGCSPEEGLHGADGVGARSGAPVRAFDNAAKRVVDGAGAPEVSPEILIHEHDVPEVAVGVMASPRPPTEARAGDRARLGRLCRYLARPPIATERLTRLEDGRVRYEMKKAWRDGTRAVLLEPPDLIARVVAMIPAPGFAFR